MRLFLPLTKYPTAEPRAAIAQQIEDRLSGVGAWQAVGLTTNTPAFGGFNRQLTVEGRPDPDAERRPEVTMVAVSDRYFETLGIPIVRGRGFNRNDGLPGYEHAIVNQRFVALHFSNEDPLGRRMTLIDPVASPVQSTPKTVTIVGVVPSIRQRNFQEPQPDPVAYLPFRADPQRFAVLVVRAPGSTGQVSSLVREEMRAIEPDVPLVGIQTMNQLLAQQRWPFRVFGTMFAIFAAIALLLSAVGLYGVTAYSVTQRTAEIGVRRALGAQSADVIWLVLRRGLGQLAVGLPLGIIGAVGVGRLLQSLLVQTSSGDIPTLTGIAVLMLGVSIAACLWPARRAARLDPVTALRYE
jgi:putative ABC transport system permease protein